jgi:hypothetical protein
LLYCRKERGTQDIAHVGKVKRHENGLLDVRCEGKYAEL